MSPESKNKCSIALVALIMTIIGTIIGASITTGATLSRLSTVERQVDAMQNAVFAIIRIESTVIQIDKRLERLENRQ